MDQSIVPLVDIEVLARRPQVALVVEVAADATSVGVADRQGEHSDIELAPMYQEGLLDVLLEDAGAMSTLPPTILCVTTVLYQVGLDLIEVVEDTDAITAIS